MKRIRLFIILLVYIVCLSSCSSNIIGKISGLENEYITIDDVVYELKSNTDFSNADKGKYLGKVSNSKITMKVYEVKGDTEENYIYTLWDWEGAFYKKVD
ncbi:MAG: hypothetical protein IKM20_08560 [Erysipelotrichales bacterium]|nr:hypothetical protein [Erysipelotrichales bacterium]